MSEFAPQHLATLEASGLIRKAPAIPLHPELEYLFRHALVQETAYASLLKSDRQRLHQAVGETLEKLYPEEADSLALAPLLAQHFAAADDYQRALHYFTLAGDAAANVYANPEAISHYTQALELAARPELAVDAAALEHLYMNRGRALELSSCHQEALANYQELVTLARQRGDLHLELSALMVITTLHATPSSLRDPHQVEILSAQALEMARRLDDRPAEAKILWNQSLSASSTGHPDLGVQYGEQSLAIARQYNLRQQMAFTLNDLESSYLGVGRLDLALQVSLEAQVLWRELNILPMLADNLSRMTILHMLMGQFDQAIQDSDEAYRISESINNLWGLSFSRMMIGQVYYLRGQYRRAAEVIKICLEMSQRARTIIPQISTRAELALVYAEQGDLAQAQTFMEQSLEAARQHSPGWGALTKMWQSRLNVRLGKLEETEMLLEPVRLAYQKTEAPYAYLQLSYLLPQAEVELSWERRDYPRLIAQVDEFTARFTKAGIHAFTPYLHLLKAQALLAQGDLESAEALLQSVQETAQERGMLPTLWKALAARAEIASRRGQLSQAQELHQEAEQAILAIADQTLPHLRQTFLEQPEITSFLAQRS